eukprot:TRINITY_DN7415_c0_g1_i2.p1 TRINITY_DN7415_c0_g1~~TRINITY_DN7415_c0_g1_i2.p1  ORF type:complete len:353 (+),score=67.86 TRINITY_DN7415_c0_g1_i2:686-1744(+)
MSVTGNTYYVIIPCTFQPGYVAPYTLTIHATTSLLLFKELCKEPPALFLKGEWKNGSAGGCFNHPSWIQNPQFQINLGRNGSYTFALTQDDLSAYIGFVLWKANPDGSRVLDKHSVLFCSKFIKAATVSHKTDLLAGTYVVMPSTYHPNQFSKFQFKIFGNHLDDCSLQTVTEPTTSFMRQGTWSKDFSSYKNWSNNPKINFHVSSLCFVTIGMELPNPPQFKDYVGLCLHTHTLTHVSKFCFSDEFIPKDSTEQQVEMECDDKDGERKSEDERKGEPVRLDEGSISVDKDGDLDGEEKKRVDDKSRERRLILASGLTLTPGDYWVTPCTQHPQQGDYTICLWTCGTIEVYQ